MVALSQVQSSNALIPSTLPKGLVGIFVGATSGIGEATVLAFAKHTTGLAPKAYIVGRNADAAAKIIKQCKALNSSGEFVFLAGDLRLMKIVDEVCDEVKKREKVVNILFISAGSPNFERSSVTSEGLPEFTSVLLYARIRFITNLLPLIRIAPSLRRISIVGGGTYEGTLYPFDLAAKELSLLYVRGHLCTFSTLALEALAKDAPEVSFVNDFPGAVDTPFSIHIKGILGVLLRTYFRLFGWLICVPIEECGERHLYYLTSARFPAKASGDAHDGIFLGKNEVFDIASGTDGDIGSGVYSVGWNGESANAKVCNLLAGYRKKGMVERVEAHVRDEFRGLMSNSE